MLWIEYYHIYETKFNLLHKSNFQLNQIHKVVHTDKWFSLNKKHALFFNFLNHFIFKAK